MKKLLDAATATGSGFLHEGLDLGEVSVYYTPYPNS